MSAIYGVVAVAFVIVAVEIIYSRMTTRDAYRLLGTLRREIRELSWNEAMPKDRALSMCDRINRVLPYDDLVGGPR